MTDIKLTQYLLSTLPVVRYAFDPEKDTVDRDRTDEHIHETQYQITLGLDPEGIIRIGNREYITRENCFFTISPYELHELKNRDGRTFPNITCRFELPGYTGPLLQNRIELNEKNACEAKCILLRLCSLQNSPGTHLRKRAPLALAELLFMLDEYVQYDSADSNAPGGPVRLALDYMHANFKDGINIDAVAQAAGISQEYLCRVFHRETGCTPSDYLQRLRLGYAVERLFASHRKLGTIALDAGFSNAKTFNAAFQKHYQCSASQFRRKHLEKEAESD